MSVGENLRIRKTKNTKIVKIAFGGKSAMKFEINVKSKLVYRDVQICCDLFDKTYVKHYCVHVKSNYNNMNKRRKTIYAHLISP